MVNAAAALLPKYYDAINNQDVGAIGPYLADDVVYDDLAANANSMHGPEEVLAFFTKVFEGAGPGLRFVIDEITENDDTHIGVLWHLENNGLVPYGKGCSFYRLAYRNGQLKITYGRELREPTVKTLPGADLDA